jgi:branched-chain amino acid transport system substrate-binding protein
MRRAVCVLALCAASVAGCADEAEFKGTRAPGDSVTLYVVAPLAGAGAQAGADVRDGAKLALNQAGGRAGEYEVNFRSVNAARGGRLTAGSTARAARRTAQDPTVIGAVAAFSEVDGRIELPLLNQASIAVVTPTATSQALDAPELEPLGRNTFARVIGDDASQADALAALAARENCEGVRVTGDDEELAGLVRDALEREGVATGGDCAVLAWRDPRAAASRANALDARVLLAPANLAVDAFTGALRPRTARRVRVIVPRPAAGPEVEAAFGETFGRPASTAALLGHDAAQAILSAVARVGEDGNDRAAVAAVIGATRPAPWDVARVRAGAVQR